jgi:hypothetical protein
MEVNFQFPPKIVTANDWQVKNSGLKRAWSADSKMLRKALLRPLGPEFIT